MNVSGWTSSPYTNIISAILGGIIIASTGILQFEKFHDRWIIFKNTKAKLMNECYCYIHWIGEYGPKPEIISARDVNDKSARDVKFVKRCESILLSEAMDFVGLFNSVNARPNRLNTSDS